MPSFLFCLNNNRGKQGGRGLNITKFHDKGKNQWLKAGKSHKKTRTTSPATIWKNVIKITL